MRGGGTHLTKRSTLWTGWKSFSRCASHHFRSGVWISTICDVILGVVWHPRLVRVVSYGVGGGSGLAIGDGWWLLTMWWGWASWFVHKIDFAQAQGMAAQNCQ